MPVMGYENYRGQQEDENNVMNTMTINGYHAVITYDEEINICFERGIK